MTEFGGITIIHMAEFHPRTGENLDQLYFAIVRRLPANYHARLLSSTVLVYGQDKPGRMTMEDYVLPILEQEHIIPVDPVDSTN